MSTPLFVPASKNQPGKSRRPTPAGRREALGEAVRAAVETLEGRVLLSSVLSPVADTFVRDHNFALTNFGASPLLIVKNANSGDDRVAYLKFDLSGVSSIGSATLQLSGSLENNLATPTDVGIYGVADSSWVEGDGTIVNSVGDGFDTDNSPPGEMTWNNSPAISGGPIATATISRDTFQTYTFDVGSYLQQQINAGNTLVTLALKNIQPSAAFTEFLSRESTSGSGSGPELVLTDNSAPPPTALVSAPDVSSPGPSEIVNVSYSSTAGIDTTTIDGSDITVTPTGGGSALSVSNVTFAPGPLGSIVASYTVDAPNGSWSAGNNGSFSVAVHTGAVTDVNGAGISAAFGSFRVNVGDTTPPSADIVAPAVTAANGSTYQFSITYTDNVAIDASTITQDNVDISGPNGSLRVTDVSLSPNGNAGTVVATYTVAAPNGAWDDTDNGQYLVTLHTNQVFDTAGNPAAGATTPFTVAIAVPDTTAPTASISAPSINAPGGATETVTVIYKDDVAVDSGSIDPNDISVTDPDGDALSISGVTLSPDADAGTITATYTVLAPNGAWDASDNGTYTVSLIAGQVGDTSGNAAGPASATFNVSAAAADTQPPAGAISAPAIGSGGGTTQSVRVTYSDNVGIDASSIDVNDISVSGPGGPLTVTSVSTSGSGMLVTATYVVSAPGGTWDASANGTYNVALNANQVRDTSGNTAPITFGSFAVNIALPNPSDDTFGGGDSVTVPFIAEAVAAQPDGKVLVAGHQSNGQQSQGVLERLNANGSLDTTFGSNGQIVTPASTSDAFYSIVVQGANHVIVAGTHNGDFSLARFDFNGNVDPTFGDRGAVFTDFGGSDTAYGIAIGQNGMIVAVGTSNNHYAFARYDANGHLDVNNFGEGGRQVYDTGAAMQALGDVAIQPDGKVVAVGATGTTIDVVRLDASGNLDTSFAGGGMTSVPGLAARTDGSTVDYTEAIALQADGKILVANKTTFGHFGLARLTADGGLDASFGSAGVASANFGGDDDADSVVVQDNGDVLVVGTTLQAGVTKTGVAAFDSTGALISSFGDSGKATFDAPTAPASRELHIGDLVLRAFGAGTAEGKLLVGASAGGAAGTTTTTTRLRRINAPGAKAIVGVQETLVGVFGLVNGKKTRLIVTDLDGTKITFTLSGGTGTAFQSDDGHIHLEITDSGKGAVLTITGKGGDGRVSFSNINVTGNLKSIKAATGDISGTLNVSGTLGKATLGNIGGNIAVSGSIASLTAGSLAGFLSAGGAIGKLKLGAISGRIIAGGSLTSLTAADLSGSIAAGGLIKTIKLGNVSGLVDAVGTIGTLSALSLSNAMILSGASLGSDGQLGGGGTGADAFGAGGIGTIKITGAITNSVIAAGVDPVNGVFGDGDDKSAGGGLIKSILAKGGATGSHFEASVFKSVKLPKKTDPASDSQFKVV